MSSIGRIKLVGSHLPPFPCANEPTAPRVREKAPTLPVEGRVGRNATNACAIRAAREYTSASYQQWNTSATSITPRLSSVSVDWIFRQLKVPYRERRGAGRSLNSRGGRRLSTITEDNPLRSIVTDTRCKGHDTCRVTVGIRLTRDTRASSISTVERDSPIRSPSPSARACVR